MIDHAARNETANTLYVRPDLPDLTQLPADRSVWPQGVGGEDPRDATAEMGEENLRKIVDLIGRMLEDAGV